TGVFELIIRVSDGKTESTKLLKIQVISPTAIKNNNSNRSYQILQYNDKIEIVSIDNKFLFCSELKLKIYNISGQLLFSQQNFQTQKSLYFTLPNTAQNQMLIVEISTDKNMVFRQKLVVF
ncbi:hypothetical protein JZU68_01380, partial [bacterium]|nr:hypothetical protein [bacterium]